MREAPSFFAGLLAESGNGPLDAAQVHALRDVFLRLCDTLHIADADDPRAPAIARRLIALALAGEQDPDVLYARTLAQFKPAH